MTAFPFSEKRLGNGSTAKERRSLVGGGNGERRIRKRFEEIVPEEKQRRRRSRDHPHKILLVKKQIVLIHGFKLYAMTEEICFHDDVITRVSPG